MRPLTDTYREEDEFMSVQTREAEAPAVPTSTTSRFSPLERVIGGVLLVAGALATAWAIPTAIRYPMAVAVAITICAIGLGILLQKSWASSGLLALGVLLCCASIGYLSVNGPSLLSFAWFFVPGAYLVWVGIHTRARSRVRSVATPISG
jgi:hypothetical protein